MPNTFAYLVLYLFPVLVVVLFVNLPRAQALVVSILLGHLFLPVATGVDLPLLPPLDKTLIPALSAALACLFLTGRRGHATPTPGAARGPADPAAARAAPTYSRSTGQAAQTPAERRQGPALARPALAAARGGADGGTARETARIPAAGPVGTAQPGRLARAVWALLALIVASQFAAALTNSDPVVIGGRYLPAMSAYDGFSRTLASMVQVLPFVLGWHYLTTARDHAMITRLLVLAGLAYSFMALIEVRLSPQLNVWVYGFFPHAFVQHMRGDGFRPLVFLPHGLWLAIFLATAILAAAGQWRQERLKGARCGEWLLFLAWLLMTLVLAKSLGALALTLGLLPLVLFASCRFQMTVAAALTALVLFYPAVRNAGLVPVDLVEEIAADINQERASSWRFRVDNEDRLLARAMERPLFGWGGWGRNAIYDAQSGQETSVTDGFWIITLGHTGWVGYLSTFGLLCLPVLAIWRRSRRLPVEPATVALAVILTCNLLDMIPNASLTPLTWLIAGALTGLATRRAGPQDDGPPSPRRAATGAPHDSPPGRPFRRTQGN